MKRFLNISALIIIIAASFIMNACSNKIIVKHVSLIDTQSRKTGVYYALPQTVISVDVKVTKTEFIKGPYNAYAGKFLGLSNVITSNAVSYDISDIEIGHFVEPDTAQYYMIESLSKSLTNKALIINLTESGLLRSINDKNELTDTDKASFTFTDKEANAPGETFNYLVDANLFEKIDTVIEKIHLDTITIEKHTLRKSLVEKDNEQRAKDVADYILQIKEKKLNIISGYAEVPYDKSTIEYMYNELDKLENEYLQLFTGIQITKTNTYRFTYLPRTSETAQPVPLFNFSASEGLLDANTTLGDEFFLVVSRKGSTIPLENLLNKKETRKRNGIYFRIPESGKVTLISKNRIKAEATMMVNQFGVVNCIKPSKIQLQLYPNSGAVKSIGIE